MGPFETEHLILRHFTIHDLDALYPEVYADPEVCQYYCGAVKSLDAVRALLLRLAQQPADAEFGRLAVTLKENGGLIGQVDLSPYVNQFYRIAQSGNARFQYLEVELSFAFGRQFWGKSLAFEACLPVVQYAFTQLKLPRLLGGMALHNARSVKLHQRLGYQVEPNLHPNWPGYVCILENRLL